MIGPTDADSFHIIGIDPGLIAGVAALTIAIASYIENGMAVTMSTSEMPWRDAVTYVGGWKTNRHVSVGSERYTIPTGRSVMTPQLDAIMCNGALDWLLTPCNVTFELQPRAEVKKLVPDTLLKKLGWYKKTKDDHANDAARHAGFRLFITRPELWLRLVDGV